MRGSKFTAIIPPSVAATRLTKTVFPMSIPESRRVVITGLGIVSPLGNSPEELMANLNQGTSGIRPWHGIPAGALPVNHGAEAVGFTGDIDQFGPLDKETQRAIRKGQKVMCREIEMGVAAAQLALHDSGLTSDKRNRDRVGVIYGCDYIMTLPEEFASGIAKCVNPQGQFDFTRWAELGLPEVNPLWLLKYLPNMPASHIAIYNDLRGPNNSITLREASSCAAICEAHSTLTRGHADALIVGATGSRALAFRAMHACMQEELAGDRNEPASMARPFAADRDGAVLGEGAAAMLLETWEHAHQRGAKILGEVVGYGCSTVPASFGENYLQQAVGNVLRSCLQSAGVTSVGHIHAHGLGTLASDAQESQAIANVLHAGTPPDQHSTPVVAAKSLFGNLGSGGGMVECIASLLCLQQGHLFAAPHTPAPAPDCPIRLADNDTPAGNSFISYNVTPQGQAAGVLIRVA